MSDSIRKYLRRLSVIICLLLPSIYSSGQIELSSGIDLTYPLLINSNNSKLTYSQISFGLGVGIAYKPAETQFFPILKASIGRTRLPLKQVDKNVVALNINYLNLMLNENFVLRFPKSEVYLYGGIGFSYLARQGVMIAGPSGESMKATIDSTKNITNAFPAMNIGFEYNYGQSAGKDLYLTMGLNFQYILLLTGRNTYDFHINKPGVGVTPYSVNLSGNLITPGFYIAIHFLMHHHKKSSMYL